jgi:polysaccharide export outer membrane protein
VFQIPRGVSASQGRKNLPGVFMRVAFAATFLLAVCGCSALPHDGPSTRSVPREAARSKTQFAMVDLDYAVTQVIATHPPKALASLASASSKTPSDLIAEGDALSVSVFEAGGGGLFERPADTSEIRAAEGARTLPRLVVDRDGSLDVPFAGQVPVAGKTPSQAAEAIRQALRRRAVDPQVTVTVSDSRANAVAVIGEVRNAGRYPISAHNDRLLDLLASAGGPSRQPADLAVAVTRGGQYGEIPLSALMLDPSQNIRLSPGDQVRVILRPRKYSTFGAFGRDSQTTIDDDTLTLAAAISQAGGLDTNTANGASVLVFRFERPEVATALGLTTPPTAKGVPIVYRLNYLRAESVFVANNFDIDANDLLYVPRSDITEAKKFFDLVNTITQIVYNVRVVSVVP